MLPIQLKQSVALTGRNTTGPQWSVGHLTASASGGRPAGYVTDDDRRQRAKQYWPIRRASNNFLQQVLCQTHSFIHSLACSKAHSCTDNFTPVSAVGCFGPCRIQSEVHWLEVVFHSMQPGSGRMTRTSFPFRWQSLARSCYNSVMLFPG